MNRVRVLLRAGLDGLDDLGVRLPQGTAKGPGVAWPGNCLFIVGRGKKVTDRGERKGRERSMYTGDAVAVAGVLGQQASDDVKTIGGGRGGLAREQSWHLQAFEE